MPEPVKLHFASSNPGKLAEFRALAGLEEQGGVRAQVEPLPHFDSLVPFEEDAPTFAENALGKALHYSQLSDGIVFADDSGLVVPALGGAPGVHSARYAGPHASSAERITKLIQEMSSRREAQRVAYFSCVIAVVKNRRPVAVVSNRVDGEILGAPRGKGGFGYDPVFYLPSLGKTFAELSAEGKNRFSHRGKAFRRVLSLTDIF